MQSGPEKVKSRGLQETLLGARRPEPRAPVPEARAIVEIQGKVRNFTFSGERR